MFLDTDTHDKKELVFIAVAGSVALLEFVTTPGLCAEVSDISWHLSEDGPGGRTQRLCKHYFSDHQDLSIHPIFME
ncbi:hypothetical protein BHYA_0090g00310 [Botrytis hyacinthi]|uniref:Uncharacterized protein n=1 Tax=Botrytis hyacinthi TaxID=278943 RepID=A0A4Z1GSJ2_9HELO|nr:hypothetical protein BHYA_0090g00310 [Botrytis hyacinthi]